MPLPSLQANIILSAAVGGLVGALGAISAQVVAHQLTRRREQRWFQIESFERLRQEYHSDTELRMISRKVEPLTEHETERLLGFFEQVGSYWQRKFIDRELVDEILGDDIVKCFQAEAIAKYMNAVRAERGAGNYTTCFERMARELIRMRGLRPPHSD
jgi:hypothetical protein